MPSSPERLRTVDWLAIAAVIAPSALFPWFFAYWPTQDDPNHLAIVHILRHLGDSDSPFAAYFTSHAGLRPYILEYYLLLGLSHVFPLVTAGRILVSLVNAAMPLSALFFTRRMAPARWRASLFVIPFGSTLTLLGFQNQVMGMCLGLVGLGVFSGRPGGRGDTPASSFPAALGGAILLALATLAHPLAGVLSCVCLLFLELPRLGKPRVWLDLAIAGAPAVAILAFALLAPPVSCVSGSIPIPPPDLLCPSPPACAPATVGAIAREAAHLVAYLVFGGVPLSRWHTLGHALAAIVLLAGAARGLRRRRLLSPSSDGALMRLWLGLLLLYFAVPESLPDNLYLLPARVALLFQLAWPALAAFPPVLDRTRVALPIALALSLGYALVQVPVATRISARIADTVAVGSRLPRGARVLPVTVRGEDDGLVKPTLHAWGFLTLSNDVITPYVFAGQGPACHKHANRPLSYARPFSPDWLPPYPETGARDPSALRRVGAAYDAILANHPDAALLKALEPDFEVAAHVRDAWLFTHRGGSR